MTRAEAIEYFKGRKTYVVDKEMRKAEQMAIEALEQEPKTGHWIKYENKHHYCSCCEEWATMKYVPAKQIIVDVLSKYCPNCGAKMVEPQESEDKE